MEITTTPAAPSQQVVAQFVPHSAQPGLSLRVIQDMPSIPLYFVVCCSLCVVCCCLFDQGKKKHWDSKWWGRICPPLLF